MQLPLLIEGLEVIGISGSFRKDISSLCYDSRRCVPGSLFTAIPGLQADGHDFIADAIARGATAVVHQGSFHPPAGITAVRVPDSRRALGLLGKNFYGNPSDELCLIAVIGTNGKTTVSYLLEAILQAAGLSVGVLGTVNYRYGGRSLAAPNTTPESLDLQRILRDMAVQGVSHVVAEVSSHAIALGRVDECRFTMGVFTNLTQDHLDYHGTMENYFQAKKRFFSEILPAGKPDRPRWMIVNSDDPWGRRILAETAGRRLTYGLSTPADITARSVRLSLAGIEATLLLGEERLEIASSLLGRFNLANILAAAAAARALGLPAAVIRKGIASLRHVPGRLERVSGAGEPAVFVDYAHTDDALRRVLENLAAFRTGRIITVFGCGGDRDRGKRPLMGEAAGAGSDLTIITSDNPRTEAPLEIIRQIEGGIGGTRFRDVADSQSHPARRGYLVLPDRAGAIATAVALAGPADIVLIAGKGHEDYQIIGTRRQPFDDRIVARRALAGRKTGGQRP
jgi:UDP-N-acetylmuramoyl-L-alanyl-D-glutamate--2,6-diaminopimelate ligase